MISGHMHILEMRRWALESQPKTGSVAADFMLIGPPAAGSVAADFMLIGPPAVLVLRGGPGATFFMERPVLARNNNKWLGLKPLSYA